jgi:hypothetical protein
MLLFGIQKHGYYFKDMKRLLITLLGIIIAGSAVAQNNVYGNKVTALDSLVTDVIAPEDNSSGVSIRNKAGTTVVGIGVGGTSSTNSTWTGNINQTGNLDITGDLYVDSIAASTASFSGEVVLSSSAPQIIMETTASNGDANIRLNGDVNWLIQNDGNGSLGGVDDLVFYGGVGGTIPLTLSTNGNADVGADLSVTGDVTAANLSAGTYTPTVTTTSNVDNATIESIQYQRVGNVVSVSGTITVNATASLTLCNFRISLPFSTTVSQNELHGTCVVKQSYNSGVVNAESNEAEFLVTTGNTDNRDVFFTFMYPIQ